MKDLLKRLQNGETAEDIAKQFAEALNAAEAEKTRIEEEQKEQNSIQETKRYFIYNLLGDIAAYLREFHGNDPDIADVISQFDDVDNDELDEMIAEIDDMIKLLSWFKTPKEDKFAKIFDFFS